MLAVDVGDLTIDDITITGGAAIATGDGGAIANLGELTVTNGTITGNSANSGAGVFNAGSADIDLVLLGATVTDNTAAAEGGAIWNGGTISIEGSLITGNSASSGGGMFNAGTATIDASTITGNGADAGGGIWNTDEATLDDSEVSNNTAFFEGGRHPQFRRPRRDRLNDLQQMFPHPVPASSTLARSSPPT